MQQEKTNAFNRQCISEALIRLMEQKEYDEITVTQICQMAGVSRMTYYRNYSNKREIFSDYMKMIVDEFVQVQKSKGLQQRSYEMILAGFLYFRSYQRFIECLHQANLSSILQDGINYYIDQYVLQAGEDVMRKYHLYYYSGALFNIYTEWMRTGMHEDVQDLAKIVYEHVKREYQT